MELQILAMSDVHLGEDTSLLSYPHGLQRLWQVLREEFGAEEDQALEVEELVLVGDIPDRALSSTSQIIANTNAFIQMLGSAAKVRKGVYVPGNHDHTLWTQYDHRRAAGGTALGVTAPAGDLIVKDGARSDTDGSAEDLLALFFGFPSGSSWRAIKPGSGFDFAVANPLYATEAGGRTYVFAHGTHFRASDVLLPEGIRKVLDYAQLDRALAHIEVESDCDVSKATSLEELEGIVAPFVDSLWPSSENNPTSQSDQVWYLYTALSGKLRRRRPEPHRPALFPQGQLPGVPEAQIRHLTPDGAPPDSSVHLWQEHFLGHMTKYLQDHAVPTDEMTFVYGDTHAGGWGQVARDGAPPMRVYNCGGWVVHGKLDHPACHVFAVDTAGGEYLLDVSFAEVKVGHDRLLDLAAAEAEHRHDATSRILRFVVDHLLPG